jgi:hypothetical protein
VLANDLRGFNLRDILQECMHRVNRGMTVMQLRISKSASEVDRQPSFAEDVLFMLAARLSLPKATLFIASVTYRGMVGCSTTTISKDWADSMLCLLYGTVTAIV